MCSKKFSGESCVKSNKPRFDGSLMDEGYKLTSSSQVSAWNLRGTAKLPDASPVVDGVQEAVQIHSRAACLVSNNFE